LVSELKAKNTAPPKAAGVYFGWRIVAALFVCTTSLIGMAMYGFIVFTGPLAQDFGWTAAQSGTLVSAMWLVGPLALMAAPVIERVGAWRLVAVGMLLQACALGMLGAGLVSEFWHLYLLRLLMGVGKIALLTAAPVIVARWFTHRFSTAMAIVWAGGGAGGMLSPAVEQLVAHGGWRQAALIVAVGLVACWGVAALLARGAAGPSDLRLGPDGEAAEGSAAGPPPPQTSAKTGWASLDTKVLASMCVAVIGAGMSSIALQSQELTMLSRAGIQDRDAAVLLGLTAAGGLIGSVGAGWVLDRLPAIWTSAGVAAAFYLGLFAFASVTGEHALWLGAIAALACGTALGAGEVLWITLFKQRFGAALFATTYGIFYFSLQVGFASGGSAGGWSLDEFGRNGLMVLSGLLYLPALALSLSLTRRSEPAP
jgi:MFS family permease